MFSKRKDSGFLYGCANAAATDGLLGSNVYEVNQWLWQFGCGTPPGPLGGLTIEETSERKDAVSNARHKPQQTLSRDSTSLQGGSSLIPSTWCCMIVCTSMYQYIPVYKSMYQYNQGLQIFMICTYLFLTFGPSFRSKIQCAVLRKCISAFINNRKHLEGMTN